MYRETKLEIIDGLVSVQHNYALGDELGSGLMSLDKKTFYVNIPKNASSELKKMFETNKWTQSNYMSSTPDEYIVVLRDPIERWISAMAEFLVGEYSSLGPVSNALSTTDIEFFLNSKVAQNLIFDSVIFDSHTLPQCWFIQGLCLDRVKFFI